MNVTVTVDDVQRTFNLNIGFSDREDFLKFILETLKPSADAFNVEVSVKEKPSKYLKKVRKA